MLCSSTAVNDFKDLYYFGSLWRDPICIGSRCLILLSWKSGFWKTWRRQFFSWVQFDVAKLFCCVSVFARKKSLEWFKAWGRTAGIAILLRVGSVRRWSECPCACASVSSVRRTRCNRRRRRRFWACVCVTPIHTWKFVKSKRKRKHKVCASKSKCSLFLHLRQITFTLVFTALASFISRLRR